MGCMQSHWGEPMAASGENSMAIDTPGGRVLNLLTRQLRETVNHPGKTNLGKAGPRTPPG